VSWREWFRRRDYGYDDFIGSVVGPASDFDPVSGEVRSRAEATRPASELRPSDATVPTRFLHGGEIIDGVHWRDIDAYLKYKAAQKERDTMTAIHCEHEEILVMIKRKPRLEKLFKCPMCGLRSSNISDFDPDPVTHAEFVERATDTARNFIAGAGVHGATGSDVRKHLKRKSPEIDADFILESLIADGRIKYTVKKDDSGRGAPRKRYFIN
jgi:hypothetical protein